MQIISLV